MNTPAFKDTPQTELEEDTFSKLLSPIRDSHSDSQGEIGEIGEPSGDTPTNKTGEIPSQKLNFSKVNAQSGSTMASINSKKETLEMDFNNFMLRK